MRMSFQPLPLLTASLSIVPQWCMQVEVSASLVCKLATELDVVLPGPQVSLVSVYNPTFRHCHCC